MKKFFSVSIVLRIISSALLFGALANNPYDYYTFLRLVTCATSAYCAFLAKQYESQRWLIIFSIVAILFNPFLPIKLGRDSWAVVDVITAVFFLFSIVVFNESKKK